MVPAASAVVPASPAATVVRNTFLLLTPLVARMVDPPGVDGWPS
jgi:hypothetical protein